MICPLPCFISPLCNLQSSKQDKKDQYQQKNSVYPAISFSPQRMKSRIQQMHKLQKQTGLDLRVFEDAITLKIALMVVKYMNYMENQDY